MMAYHHWRADRHTEIAGRWFRRKHRKQTLIPRLIRAARDWRDGQRPLL
jgi:hypothetical protein